MHILPRILSAGAAVADAASMRGTTNAEFIYCGLRKMKEGPMPFGGHRGVDKVRRVPGVVNREEDEKKVRRRRGGGRGGHAPPTRSLPRTRVLE